MRPKQQSAVVQMLANAQINKAAAQIKRETVQQVYAVMLRNLHDKHEFTPLQLVQIFEQCTADFECISGKYAKIEDFYGLLEQLGIKVKE